MQLCMSMCKKGKKLRKIDCFDPLPSQYLLYNHRKFQEVPSGQSSYDAVGRPQAHKSAMQQATGEAVYCDDIPRIEGYLFALLSICQIWISWNLIYNYIKGKE